MIVCQSNTLYLKNILSYFYDIYTCKIEYINSLYTFLLTKYKSLLEEASFQIRPTTNSALRTLNKKEYMDIFNFENNYFLANQTGAPILFIYKLFFQFIRTFEDKTTYEFVDEMKVYFKEKTKTIGLGDYIKSIISKIDLSLENLEKINDILTSYKTYSIDPVFFAKVCRTSGILAFFIKDILIFCGIDYDKIITEKNRVVSDINQVKQIKIKTEKIVRKVTELNQKFNN